MKRVDLNLKEDEIEAIIHALVLAKENLTAGEKQFGKLSITDLDGLTTYLAKTSNKPLPPYTLGGKIILPSS